MSEKRFPVQPVGVAYLCDECQRGLAVATGKTNPEGLHRHTCNQCGFNYFFKVKYPTVEWRFPKLEEVQSAIIKGEQEKQDEKTTEESPQNNSRNSSNEDELRKVPNEGNSPVTDKPIKRIIPIK